MNTLNTIPPTNLRVHHDYHCSGKNGFKFIILGVIGLTGFDVRMGVWITTSRIEDRSLIVLHKPDVVGENSRRFFYQESLYMLRQDEFEWMLREIKSYSTFNDLIGHASAGNNGTIIIYTYLVALAEYFKRPAESIFEYLSLYNYNPKDLMKTCW
jgi:hypothetical protein